VTISVGVCSLEQSDDADSLVARADTAMYRAKNSGRNAVRSANSAPAANS
jgi:diguanylate cyclase (GGDEF)-like protein